MQYMQNYSETTQALLIFQFNLDITSMFSIAFIGMHLCTFAYTDGVDESLLIHDRVPCAEHKNDRKIPATYNRYACYLNINQEKTCGCKENWY